MNNMAKHGNMKGAAPVQSNATSASRYTDKKVGPAGSTKQKPSLGGDYTGLGKGTSASRYTSSRPGGSSGIKGPALPLSTDPPVFNPQNASVLGKSVYRSSKPAKKG